MIKNFVLSLFILLVLSCKDNKEQANTADASTFEIQTEGWPKKVNPNATTLPILKGWQEFNSMEISFDAIYNVINTEDLTLVLEDLIEKQKELEESEYPAVFDTPQIKSRQKVLHTFILKTKGNLIYQLDAQKSILEMINAHNEMMNQMNVITSNTLDLKTLLEEGVK